MISFLPSCFSMGEQSMPKKILPYTTWESPITAEKVCEEIKFYGNLSFDQGNLYWTEVRPSEKGRSVIVSEQGTLTPPGYNVRTRVHEYGGKSHTIHNGTIYFVNFEDQRIYIQNENEVRPLTAEGIRFGDLCATEKGLIAIGERHRGKQYTDVDNFLSYIDKSSGTHTILTSGYDFYSSPCLSPDGKTVSWLSWNFPNMPWDGTELWTADFSEGSINNAKKVAGGKEESIFQPQWSPDGFLYFVSDKNGWWNLYRLKENEYEAIYPLEAEFGTAQWLLGMSSYSFTNEGLICTYFKNSETYLALINLNTKEMQPLLVNGNYFNQIRSEGTIAAYIKGNETSASAIFKLDLDTMKETVLAENKASEIDSSYFSAAKPIEFPSKDGRISYGYYYSPKNKDFTGPKGELPPLIIEVHGGPTANVTGVFNLRMQYWTSRGYAVLDVNYGGSTGYGREYRRLLNNNWGVVDVEDCEAGAKYLIEQGLINPNKIAITGGSAGGYTALAGLAFTNTFSVAASYFGVADPALLTQTTHKFEAHYFDLIVAPYPARKDIYDERSPLKHVNNIKNPVVFFQGLEDKIVTPDQSELMYEALKKRNITTSIFNYAGEGHGFRRAENLIDSLRQEHTFYQQVFGEDL